MAEESKIAWTDATMNFWQGCTKVSPGCDHCYAEALVDTRWKKVRWGAGQPRVRTSASNWKEPLRWQAGAGRFFAAYGRRRRVFTSSLADVFDNEVDPQWRADAFAVMEATPDLDWLVLTKRVGNVRGMVPPAWLDRWPAHVRIGATIVTQEEADRDVVKLLALRCPTFVSMEPLLGPVDLTRVHGVRHNAPFDALNDRPDGYVRCVDHASGHCLGDCPGRLPAIGWVIVGGESGRGARPFDVAWAADIVRQCIHAGVPVLVKQLGANPIDTRDGALPRQRDPKGGDPAEWPSYLRVQQFPGERRAKETA
jgi:protein gp37